MVKVGTIELSAGNVAGEIPMVKLPEMPAALPGLLGEDVPAYTITEVLRELTKREDRSAAGEVTEKLHHADSHVRVAALIYFSSVEYKAALSNIVGLLADPDVDVRDAAFHAVIRQGDDAVEPLLEMLEANDAVTRATAASLLGEVGSPRAESALIKSASDRGVYSITFGDEQLVAATALRALAKLQSAAAAPIVMDALNDTNASVKSAAISAARDLKLQTAVPKLLEIGNSSNARSRKAAKEALSGWGLRPLKCIKRPL